jgi:chromosome segregation ATPase
MTRSTKVWMILLPLLLGFAGFWLARAIYRSTSEQARITQLETENAELKSSLEKLRANVPTPSGPTDDARVAPGSPSRTPLKREPSHVDDTGAIRTLRDSLSAANQSIAEWQTRAGELQAQLDQVRDEQKRLAAIQSDLNEQIASSKRLVEAKDAELTRKTEQLAQLEAANKKLSADVTTAGQKASQVLKSADELQEIYRRRESSLNILINRYKDVTEQYRAFASVLENRRGPEGTAGSTISIAGPELSRIQNTITMAEEDLRQLNALNAQALRLQKKLSGK